MKSMKGKGRRKAKTQKKLKYSLLLFAFLIGVTKHRTKQPKKEGLLLSHSLKVHSVTAGKA